MGVLDTVKANSLESSDLGFTWGRRMRVSVHKKGATSRCSPGFSCQRHNVEVNVATFQGSLKPTSRCKNSTSQCSREC